MFVTFPRGRAPEQVGIFVLLAGDRDSRLNRRRSDEIAPAKVDRAVMISVLKRASKRAQ
jgi:hypothetical protein